MTTTETLTLVQFLTQALDADEAAARAAADVTDGMGEVIGPQWNVVTIAYEGIHVWPRPGGLDAEGGLIPVTAHMQRHDPARVLAEVAAKRAIVEMHHLRADVMQHNYCEVCFVGASVNFDAAEVEMESWPCPTLRALASVYAGAPGWDESWR